MPVDCQRSTSGGKGNRGMFIERDPKICAAGLPTQQPDAKISDSLEHYLLKDEVDALIGDAIDPDPKPRPLPPLRHPMKLDLRNSGPYNQVASLINPPILTKFQTLVEDLKDTAYASYWKKPAGRSRDAAPMLPKGFKPLEHTFGKETEFHGRLYDLVMPPQPFPDNTPVIKQPGIQLDRNYCKPPFNPDLIFGHKTGIDKRGRYAKCCLTDDRIVLGTAGHVIVNNIQANFQDAHEARLGTPLCPNDNIKEVPEGYTFGKLKPPDNLPECLTYCEINPGRIFFKKCLAHLNSLRRCMSKRFLPTFYRGFYLNLKYYDKEKTGWLAKEIVYEYCGTKHIRFDPVLLEPLLSAWNAFDGSRIEYKTFVHILNYKHASPELPKIEDIDSKCLDFRTTYTEMVKPENLIPDSTLMAGLPSGRYFDMDYPITPENCCRAIRICLPQESDVRSCLNPSVLTNLGVSHRDMFAKRDPETVKQVFEATGENFSDERFSTLWSEAQKQHSQGWVCFETFRNVLEADKQATKSAMMIADKTAIH